MDINSFVRASLGAWKSQRSVHHLAFGHFEAVTSAIEISALAIEAPEVIALCKSYDIAPTAIESPFRMSWRAETDWDEQVTQGNSIFVPVPQSEHSGQLLREIGYAEEAPAIATYTFTNDGTFVLTTPYDRAAAEEKIWFVTPALRCRVSLIKTSSGQGAVTASFSSEIKVSDQAPATEVSP
jgi:phycoerythrin-associated linker protein